MDTTANLIWSFVGGFIAIFNCLVLIFLFRHRTSIFVKGMFHHLVAVCACDILVGITLVIYTLPVVTKFKENIYICVGSLIFFGFSQILSHASVFGLILRRFFVIRNLHVLAPSYGWNKTYIVIMLATSVTVLITSCGAFIYLLPPKSEIQDLECVISIIYMNNARKLYGVLFFWLIIFLLGSNVLCFACIKLLKRELRLRLSAEKDENATNSLETVGLTDYLTTTSGISTIDHSIVKQDLSNVNDRCVLEQQHALDHAENDNQTLLTKPSSSSFERRTAHNSCVIRNNSFCEICKTGGVKPHTTCTDVNFKENACKRNVGLLDISSPKHERDNVGKIDNAEKAGQRNCTYSLLSVKEVNGISNVNVKELINCDSIVPIKTVNTLKTERELAKSTQRNSQILRRCRPFIAKVEKKALVTLSIVVMLLNVSTAPTIVIVVIMALGGDISYTTRAIVGCSMCLNSLFNTMIYVLRIQSLREHICDRRRVKHVEEVDASTQT